MRQYLELLQKVINTGSFKEDRTKTGTYSLFGHQMRFHLADGFPLLTTKKLHLRSIVHELLWFLSGSTNVGPLQENGVTIWDEWADENGELGPVYGRQWRAWPDPERQRCIDQIGEVERNIRRDPYSRRHIVSAWNPAQISKMALPPCHLLFQFYVNDQFLSCQIYQRSVDVFLGLPFNIASYALLTMMMAQSCGLEAKELIHTSGDVHLYSNHVEQARIQLARKPKQLPIMRLNPERRSIDEFKFEDFTLENYAPEAHISARVAI